MENLSQKNQKKETMDQNFAFQELEMTAEKKNASVILISKHFHHFEIRHFEKMPLKSSL
jgi:UDP-2,3-diacylglucosamine pyrophosphatase LpxH